MKIPFLDLKQQYKSIKEEIDPAIQNVIDNTAFILGKPVSDFEQEFAKAHNVKHCICVSSGTDGNHLVLWTLGIGAGDEVIIPVKIRLLQLLKELPSVEPNPYLSTAVRIVIISILIKLRN